MRFTTLVPTMTAALAAGCGPGADGTETGADPIEEGCYHVAEGTIVDAGPSEAEATPLTPGGDPFRVNLYPDQVSWVEVQTGAGQLVLMTEASGVINELLTDGEAVDLGEGFENPTCPQDIAAVFDVAVSGGTHRIGLGPYFQASVWLLVTLR